MKRVFDVHVWRRHPPCAWHCNKGYLLNNVHILLGYYRIFESIGTPDRIYAVQLRDPIRTGRPWAPSGAFPRRGSSPYLDHSGNRQGPSV